MAGAVRDLFSTLESFMTDKTGRSRRSGDASDQLHGRRHRGARRPRARAPPPRHVHRRHRREGAAPPLRRGDRQLHGRGRRRPRERDRGRARQGRLLVGHRQRPRHPRRPAPQVQAEVGARGDPDDAALGRQVREQGLQYVGRPARRRRRPSSTRCRKSSRSRSRAASSSTRWSFSAARRRASSRSSAPS